MIKNLLIKDAYEIQKKIFFVEGEMSFLIVLIIFNILNTLKKTQKNKIQHFLINSCYFYLIFLMILVFYTESQQNVKSKYYTKKWFLHYWTRNIIVHEKDVKQ